MKYMRISFRHALLANSRGRVVWQLLNDDVWVRVPVGHVFDPRNSYGVVHE